jgi:hypothetical protein
VPVSRHDLILNEPFSLAEFKTTQIGIVASQAIERCADDMLSAANAGEPPIAVIAPLLTDLICENLYWRMVDRMIAQWLGPQYEKAGNKSSTLSNRPRARCYKRVE